MDLFQTWMSPYQVPGVSQPAPMTREEMLAHVAPKPAWERHHRAPLSADQLLNVRPGGVDRMRQVDPNWSVDLLAFTPGATAGTNAAKIGTTLAGLQTQPLVSGSGGMVLEPVAAGLAPAQGVAAGGLLDPTVKQRALAGEVALEAATGQGATTIAPRDQRLMMASSGAAPAYGFRSDAPRDQRLMMASQGPAEAPLDQRLMMGPLAELAINSAASGRGVSPDPNVDATLNVSGGGPGTSTAKGQRSIASQRARRSEAARAAARRALTGRAAAPVMVDEVATGMGPTPLHRVAPAAPASAAAKGNGFLRMVDDVIMQPGHAVGATAEQGLRNAAAMAYRADMHGIAGALKRAAPVARWAAPAGLFAATTGLPAVFGAIDGNEKAGVGGGMIQGGSALAGGVIGGLAFGPIGAAIGSTIGGFAGGGLTNAAQALTGKAHEGDTGVMGNLGRMLDPIIDTEAEKEMKAFAKQVNSPAMLAIRQQQQQRETEARIAMQDQAIMQMAMQGYY